MRRISTSANMLLALFASAINSSVAAAQTVVISQTDRGWYVDDGFSNASSSNVDNYLVGKCCLGVREHRNFFVFDLASVAQPIASAKLALSVPGGRLDGYSSPNSSENYELHDFATSIATLVDGTGGVTAFEDLGSGVVYGSRIMTAADNGSVVEITLNPAAIADLNSATGLIAIGGSLTTIDGGMNEESTFGHSEEARNITELRMTLVPEPSSAILVCMASPALPLLSRCRRLGERTRR
jgi:hypothetical protein